jgi:hypothetical protein
VSTNKHFLISFIAYGAVITLIFGVSFAMVQQSLRMGANDPQIQLAEDGARALEGGGAPVSVVSRDIIDVSQSLAPFVIVLDKDEVTPLESSVKLHSTIPVPPKGVLDYALANGENRLTWQPENGVRIALVVVPYTSSARSGFVLAGRSLREVEIRESSAQNMALVGWLISIVIGFVALYLKK